MHFIVYILFSKTCSKFYTGQTQDFENRFTEHNKGATKSIKSCRPWILIWSKEAKTRSDAVNLETKIKSRGAARFLADLGVSVEP